MKVGIETFAHLTNRYVEPPLVQAVLYRLEEGGRNIALSTSDLASGIREWVQEVTFVLSLVKYVLWDLEILLAQPVEFGHF